jgi:signal transduction histidine kinase
LDNIGNIWLKLGKLEEALNYCLQSLAISEKVNDQKGEGNALLHLANIFQQMGQKDESLSQAQRSLDIRHSIADKKGEAEVLLFLSSLHSVLEERELHFRLLQQAINGAEETGALDLLAKVHWQFYKSFKDCHLPEEALRHLELYGEVERRLHKDALNQKVLNLEILHRADKAKKEAEIFRLRNIELANMYEESRLQKEEIELKKKQIEDSFAQLKAAQAQLIHAEKMASLGELTAGIAHEIQNPLNFVNNFSEVNIELTDELMLEFNKAALSAHEKANLNELIKDIVQNQQKICYHGKRADAIVKSMLQHSRKSSGQKEPTDINVLADEYLRLSYHGLRAKEKNFNATLQTDFDENIGLIMIVPQDIGRVLLNLFNNALYAVCEKMKQQSTGYNPIVSVHTKKMDDKVEIRVRDNGLGISKKVLDKIFQPFFTTKPTGEGTGLGLSLSYDIITKEHGGELKVATKDGEWAEFLVVLPTKEASSTI